MSRTSEDEGVARRPDGPGLDQELDRLLDRHEVPGHLRIGDGQRPAGGDLGVEDVEHRPPAAQDVPEPHAQEGPGATRGRVGGEALGDVLAVAEDAHGVGGLVGGHVHEPLDSVSPGLVQHVLGSPHVGLDCLARLPLQQGEVLERRRVEHDLGPVGGEDLVQPGAVAQIGDHDVR
jgi:hypothetical protein